jgi:hypothetical protein
MDIVVKVLEPADDHALIALEDAKIMLGLTGGEDDQQLQMLIEQNSATIARLCNRVFAKEKVRETHSAAAILLLPSKSRIFLTHYPVKEDDIESVEAPGGTLVPLIDYVVEEQTGKLTVAGLATEIVVTYTGGYDLPDESPLDLQQALVVTIRETRSAAQQAAVTGIRMISHKSSRVMFHPPGGTTTSRTSGISSGSATQQALNNLLMRYTRIEA